MTAENAPHGEKSGLAATALAAMGVVFGDIGTSPLYTVKEVFGGHHPLAVTPENVLGILSLVFWALTITVSLKYVVFITRADNKGEGGIMALTALALRTANASPRVLWMMSALGIFGAALFYGDAVITPAMSVLSAIEGLEVATPLLKPYVLPITVAISGCAFCFSAARHGNRGGAVRAADDVLVCHPGRARPVERDPVSVGAGRHQSLVRAVVRD
jgi:KUP system potassium uptake protein